jgi:hypothetical protein
MTDIANTVETIEAANPVPSQLSFPAGALSSDGLLARIDERSLAMTSTQPHIRPTDPGDKPGRLRGPLVAVTVAAVVVLIIGLATLSVLTGGENPVTDDPQPTTIGAPVPEGTPFDIVDGYIAARNQHSADDMASYFAANATIDGDLATTATGYDRVVEFERITGWEFTLGDCREVTAVQDQSRLQCPFTFENDWSKALGLGPIGTSRTAFTFTISDDGIERLAMVLDIGEINFDVPGQNYTVVNDPFVEWLDRTHPDDRWAVFNGSQCFPGGTCAPLLTDEALDLWEQYSDEFVEFASSQGTPDP